MTFLSPCWRSLNPLKGSLNHPKKVTLNHLVYRSFQNKWENLPSVWHFLFELGCYKFHGMYLMWIRAYFYVSFNVFMYMYIYIYLYMYMYVFTYIVLGIGGFRRKVLRHLDSDFMATNNQPTICALSIFYKESRQNIQRDISAKLLKGRLSLQWIRWCPFFSSKKISIKQKNRILQILDHFFWFRRAG